MMKQMFQRILVIILAVSLILPYTSGVTVFAVGTADSNSSEQSTQGTGTISTSQTTQNNNSTEAETGVKSEASIQTTQEESVTSKQSGQKTEDVPPIPVLPNVNVNKESEEKASAVKTLQNYLICSDGSWSGGTIWYVQSGSNKHYIFCLEKGATMYHGKYTGVLGYKYSDKSAFQKAAALNFFYQTNGNKWSGKKNYGSVQEVIWDETGSVTAQKLTTYINQAWRLTSLNSGRQAGSSSFSSKLTPVKKSMVDSEADRKNTIKTLSAGKNQVKMGEEEVISLSGSAWKYFADGGYTGDGLISGAVSTGISVSGVYDINGKKTKSSAYVDDSGKLHVTAENEGVSHDKTNPLTVIMKVKFDYLGADKIRYLNTDKGLQNLTYDTEFSTYGYFALQVYTRSDEENAMVYINKVDEFGNEIPGCTFRLTGIEGEALAKGIDIPDKVINDSTDYFEIEYPGTYQIVETAVPANGEYQLSTIPFTFTAAKNSENKIVLSAILPEGTFVTNELSFTYTCTNTSSEGAAEITKYGEVLTGYQNGVFTYEKRALPGVQFSFYAAEDIYINDTLVFGANTVITNGTNWGGKDAFNKSLHTVAISGKEEGYGPFKTVSTNENGKLAINSIPAGNYYCIETKALSNFTNPRKRYYFTVHPNQTTQINGENGIINEQAPAACHVYKVDVDSSKPLKGGEFTIYADVANINYDGNSIFSKSDTVPTVIKRNLSTEKETIEEGTWVPLKKVMTRADGCAEFDGLPAGRYLVVETKAPAGYELAEESYMFTHSYSNPQSSSGYNFEHTFRDTPIRELKIEKQIEDAQAAHPAAKNTEVYIYGTKPGEGIVFGIYAAEPIYDRTGGLAYQAEEQITTCSTGKDGTASYTGNLYVGSYYAKELKTADDNRYSLDETRYPFTITTDKLVTKLTEKSIVNRLIKGSIQVIKTDGKMKVPLEGVEFDLLDAEKETLGSFVTDANGEILIDKLPVGTYYLKETVTKEGYQLEEKLVEVILTGDNMDQVVTVKNYPNQTSITVKKHTTIRGDGGVRTGDVTSIGALLLLFLSNSIGIVLILRKKK